MSFEYFINIICLLFLIVAVVYSYTELFKKIDAKLKPFIVTCFVFILLVYGFLNKSYNIKDVLTIYVLFTLSVILFLYLVQFLNDILLNNTCTQKNFLTSIKTEDNRTFNQSNVCVKTHQNNQTTFNNSYNNEALQKVNKNSKNIEINNDKRIISNNYYNLISSKKRNNENERVDINDGANYLNEIQLLKIYKFFIQYNFISENISFESFSKSFLNEQLIINCQNIVLREFYDHLMKSKNIKVYRLEKFLYYFIDIKSNRQFNIRTFKNNAGKCSILTDEINNLFRDFRDQWSH